MGVLSWILLGLIAGALARMVTPGKGPSGCIPTVVVGVVGALVGGFVATGLGAEDGVTGFNIWSLLVAVGGAVFLLVVFRVLRRD